MTTNRLAIARNRAHLSQAELSELSGVSRATIIRWEKQENENGGVNIKQSDLKKLSEILGVTTSYLVGFSEKMTSATPDAAPENNNMGADTARHRNTPPDGGNDSGKIAAGLNTDDSTTGKIWYFKDGEIMVLRVMQSNGFSDTQRLPLFPREAENLKGKYPTEKLFAFEISDNVMDPYLSANDYAVCVSTDEVHPGQLVVCKMFGQYMIRGIRWNDSGRICKLVCGNKEYSDIDVDAAAEDLEILGLVVLRYKYASVPGVLM